MAADPPTDHFFKFIPPGLLFNLSIPSSFLTKLTVKKRYWKAKLRRGSHEWSVEIDDGVLGDGWRRFVRENGVQELDFVVFKYQGNMVFDFLVFDQSTCERQYPNLLSSDDEMDVEEEEPLTVTESDNLGKNFVKKRIHVKETSSSLNNYRYFISNLTRTSIERSVLYLPVDFSIANGLQIGEMILRDNKGRSWNVHLRKMRKRSLYIGLGLRPFLVANGMKEGDAFKFDLVEKQKDKPPIVNFLLVKSKPTKSCKEAQQIQREWCPTLCEEGVSYFVGKLPSSSIKRSKLYLPKQFALSNGLINDKKMILKSVEDERSWSVELKNHKNKFYYIARGWTEFRVANGLKEGDYFKFELVENGEMPIVIFYFQRNC